MGVSAMTLYCHILSPSASQPNTFILLAPPPRKVVPSGRPSAHCCTAATTPAHDHGLESQRDVRLDV